MLLDAPPGAVTLTEPFSALMCSNKRKTACASVQCFLQTELPGVVEVSNEEMAPFETAPPLLCLIMKGAIFSSSLAAASSAWLKLGEDLPGGVGARRPDWLNDRVNDGWLFVGRSVGWLVGWMAGWGLDNSSPFTKQQITSEVCVDSPLNKHNHHSVIYRRKQRTTELTRYISDRDGVCVCGDNCESTRKHKETSHTFDTEGELKTWWFSGSCVQQYPVTLDVNMCVVSVCEFWQLRVPITASRIWNRLQLLISRTNPQDRFPKFLPTHPSFSLFMPVMDGCHVCKRARSMCYLHRTRDRTEVGLAVSILQFALIPPLETARVSCCALCPSDSIRRIWPASYCSWIFPT